MSKLANLLFAAIRLRYRISQYFCTGLMFLALHGCGSAAHEIKLSGDTMGTRYNLTVVSLEPVDQVLLQVKVDAVMDDVNRRMSSWLPDSEVSRFNASPSGQWFPVSADVVQLIELAKVWHRWSEGAFDLTAAPLVDLWDFGPEEMTRMPVAAEITAALDMVGQNNLKTRRKPPALYKSKQLRIDLSSIAKGYAVDLVAEELQANGITDYLVEIGGEIRLLGRNKAGQPWRVGIERPDRGGAVGAMAFVKLNKGAVATSGDYRNFFVEQGRYYSHMIDARSGYPVQSKLAAVTVFDDQATQADGLATMLQVMGEEAGFNLAEARGIAALFVMRAEVGYIERATSHARMTIEH